MYLLDTCVISDLRCTAHVKQNSSWFQSLAPQEQQAQTNLVAWSDTVLSLALSMSAVTVLELEQGVSSLMRRDPKAGAILRSWLDHAVMATKTTNRSGLPCRVHAYNGKALAPHDKEKGALRGAASLAKRSQRQSPPLGYTKSSNGESIVPPTTKFKGSRKVQKSVVASNPSTTVREIRRTGSGRLSPTNPVGYDPIAATGPRRHGHVKSRRVNDASPGEMIEIKLTHFGDVFRGGPTSRIDLIKGGVHATEVARIAQLMDRSKEQVSKTLGLAVSTVDRKAKANERLSTEQGERVVALAKMIGQVQTMVEESGNPEGFDAAQWLASWLERSVPALGGRCPGEYMDTAEGRELLSQLLAMTQSGAYA